MNQEQIRDFKSYMKREGKRDKTIREYSLSVKKLFQYFDEKGLNYQEVRGPQALDFQLWIIELGKSKQGGYASGTVVCIMKAALMFFDYLKSEDLVYENPFREIRWIKEKRGIPKAVPKEKDMHKLLKDLSLFYEKETFGQRMLSYRYHVLAELLYSTGMRINEAAKLKLENIDFEKGVILLHDTKEKKERFVFLNSYSNAVLRIYIEKLRPLMVKKETSSFFGLSLSTLKGGLNEYLKELGDARLTTRTFRHAFGYHLLRAGCNIRYIQELLGHRSLVSTEKYTKVEKGDLKEVIEKYHPRKWSLK